MAQDTININSHKDVSNTWQPLINYTCLKVKTHAKEEIFANNAETTPEIVPVFVTKKLSRNISFTLSIGYLLQET